MVASTIDNLKVPIRVVDTGSDLGVMAKRLGTYPKKSSGCSPSYITRF